MKGQFYAKDEAAMLEFGQVLFTAMQAQGVVFLQGDLGLGKTTLCRGVIWAAGHKGAVKSPTYTLVEPYEFASSVIYHFDLYRLADPEELEYLGIRDYFSSSMLSLIEWPDKGKGCLPVADIEIELSIKELGRLLTYRSGTEKGALAVVQIEQLLAAVVK
ncbi:MAG: tRNA (adenosine(37)-N6)-threonylcarbamoyltransferase complex ATPase subunit type 1 TsaE [Oceanospirillaceae bacterium]|nr:tRNA (adenosine(37)-N6)-threonylcarbamoyltransferase complex ATPase subunit type 1 TsaE [Oceanospirillaceae bacterium]